MEARAILNTRLGKEGGGESWGRKEGIIVEAGGKRK